MVVTFDNTERNAKLSLRQSEILAKLQTIVDDIASDSDGYAYVTDGARTRSRADLLVCL